MVIESVRAKAISIPSVSPPAHELIVGRGQWTQRLGIMLLVLLASSVFGRADEVNSKKELLGRSVKVVLDTKLPGNPIVGMDLSKCRITDKELKQLMAFKELRTLNLSWNQFLTDAGLKELTKLQNLQSLDLRYNRITDSGLKHLKAIKTLQTLKLDYTQITDAGIKELRDFKNLKTIYISNTKASQEAINQLQRDLPKLRIK
jgi:Leucine-rich repeat (LRR) protein